MTKQGKDAKHLAAMAAKRSAELEAREQRVLDAIAEPGTVHQVRERLRYTMTANLVRSTLRRLVATDRATAEVRMASVNGEGKRRHTFYRVA